MTFNFLILLLTSLICYGDAAQYYSNKENIASVDDTHFGNLIKYAINTIESESTKDNAMQLVKILDAKASGTSTKISMALAFTNCKKSLSVEDQKNCTIVEDMDTYICNVQIYEKKMDKNIKITYSCTGSSLRESIPEKKTSITANKSDPQIHSILQEALKSLEIQLNKNNNLKVVDIKSVSTELAAGLLTKVAFTVGYTDCRKDSLRDQRTCELLQNEPLRQCEVHAWNSSSLEGGRQINVTCETDKPSGTENNAISVLRKKRMITGGEMQQDPNDPEYQLMARDVVYNHLHIKKENIRNITVNSVTTQVVAGFVTRIKFRVFFVNGKSKSCTSAILERVWLKEKKSVSVECGKRVVPQKKKLHHTKLSLGTKRYSLNDNKYKELAKDSVKNYFKNHPDKRHEIAEIKVKNVAVVRAKVSQQDIIYINLNVVTENSGNLSCSVLFGVPGDNEPISVNCIEDRPLPGGKEWADPSKRKFANIAETSLRKSKKSVHNVAARKHDTIVTFVVRSVVAGYRDTINFIVRPERGPEYTCRSDNWEKLRGEVLVKNLNCHRNNKQPSGQVDAGDQSMYKELAEASVAHYFGNYPEKNYQLAKAEIKNIAVLRTRLTHEKIVYVNLDVVTNNGNNLKCSVLFGDSKHRNPISVDCIEVLNLMGGKNWDDPSRTKYLNMAEKSIKKYKSTNRPHDTIVTFVVRAVVAGTLNTIEFIYRPVEDQELKCRSIIWEKLSENVIQNVTCHHDEDQK